MHLHPQGRKKFFWHNLQEKFVSAPPAHQVHPQAEQESIFRTFLLGGRDLEVGVVHLVVLDHFLTVTTKKRSSTFVRKKVHPQTILATPVSQLPSPSYSASYLH